MTHESKNGIMFIMTIAIVFLMIALVAVMTSFEARYDRAISLVERNNLNVEWEVSQAVFEIEREAVELDYGFWTLDTDGAPWFVWNLEAVQMGWGYIDENNVYHMSGENE